MLRLKNCILHFLDSTVLPAQMLFIAQCCLYETREDADLPDFTKPVEVAEDTLLYSDAESLLTHYMNCFFESDVSDGVELLHKTMDEELGTLTMYLFLDTDVVSQFMTTMAAWFAHDRKAAFKQETNLWVCVEGRIEV